MNYSVWVITQIGFFFFGFRAVTGELKHGDTELHFDDFKRSTEYTEQIEWVPGKIFAKETNNYRSLNG
jgi:hypothetical protein